MEGGTLIRTANDDKNVTATEHLSLTLCRQTTVYVAYDRRATMLPNWLSGPEWTLTSESVTSTDAASPMQVYSSSRLPGELMLGGNQNGGPTGASSNYLVVLPREDILFSDGFESGDASAWVEQ